MATKNDDVSDQLSITQKLASTIEKMVVSNDRLEEAYRAQAKTLGDVLNSTAKINSQNMQFFATLADNAGKAQQSTGGLNTQFTKSIKQMALMNKGSDQLGDKVLKSAKKVTIAGAAMSGFYQGLRNVVAIGKGIFGVLGSIASGMFHVGASIIAIPFKIFTRFIDMAAGAGGGMSELAEAVRKMRMEFGSLAGPTNKSIIEVAKSMTNFNETGLSTFRVFGMFPARLEYLIELAKEMGPTFNKFTDEFRKNGGALLAYQKGLGLTGEQFAAFGNLAIANGTKVSDVLKDTTKYTYALGTAFGLDAKLISKDMGKALVDVKHFAGATVKSIAEASVYARKLGVELEKITGTLDAFETFDTAAENAAKLSQSFGVTVDAFKLMQAQDPASQVDQLRKAFAQAGKSTENMTRQELKLLSQTTGLDEATAKLAFSSRNQSLSLDEVKKKGGEAASKTMTQVEAMKKLADAIERLVMSGMTQRGGFFEQFMAGMFRGIQSSKEFRSAVWNVKLGLQAVLFEGVRLGRALVGVVPGLRDFLQGLADIFQPGKYKKFAHATTDAFIQFFKDLSDPSGKASFSNLMDNLRKGFFNFFDSQNPAGQKMLMGFKTMFLALTNASAQGITWVSDKIADGLNWIIDTIQHPEKLMAIASGGASAGASFAAKAITPLVGAVVHAWEVLTPQLMKLFKLIVGKVAHFLSTNEELHAMLRKAIPALALTIFGPAFLRGVLATLSGSLLSTGLSTGIKKLTARFAAKGLTGVGSKALGATGIGAIVLAAVSVAQGVDKYTNLITAKVDRSSKTIGAGLTGLVDGITLGLLPDDLLVKVANVASEASDGLFNVIGKYFGSGFGDSIKKMLASEFEVLGNLWSFIKNFFTGDQASTNQSAIDLGLSILRLLTTALEYTFIQVPILITRLSAQVVSLTMKAQLKLMSMALGFVASGIDKVFGTSLADKVASTSQYLQDGISKITDKTVAGLSAASDAVSSATTKFNDSYLRSEKDKQKAVAQAATSATGAVPELSEEKVKSLEQVAARASSLKDTFEKLKDLSDTSESVMKSVSSINADAMKPAVEAVRKMLDNVSELDNMLSDSRLNRVNIASKLTNVARAVGFGAKGTYTIENKPVIINVNFEITMNADQIEQAMVIRGNSTIRQRLDALSKENNMGPQILPNSTYNPAAGSPPALGRTGGFAQ